MPGKQQYWLFKSEPTDYSIQDLAAAPEATACWDGVRNYQARNLLRDDVRIGDGVLFYHSNCKPPAVVGTARVVRNGYPDPTQFDPGSDHPDPRSDPGNPRWYAVDIRLKNVFAAPLDLATLRSMPALEGMALLQRGQRLSVQPVSPAQWRAILAAAGRS